MPFDVQKGKKIYLMYRAFVSCPLILGPWRKRLVLNFIGFGSIFSSQTRNEDGIFLLAKSFALCSHFAGWATFFSKPSLLQSCFGYAVRVWFCYFISWSYRLQIAVNYLVTAVFGDSSFPIFIIHLGVKLRFRKSWVQIGVKWEEEEVLGSDVEGKRS